ncbi:hypothetical protein JCM9743_15880 [Natrinema sp. JCM 9743]
MLTVSGIVFLLAGLVLAASGASVSSAVGSVTDRFDDSDQPADDGIEPSDDSAADAGSGNETDETSGENDESGDGTVTDGEGDNGDSDESTADGGESTDSDDGETDGDRSDGDTDGNETDGDSDGGSGDGDDGPHTVTVTVEDRDGNAIAGANVSHNGTVGNGQTTDGNGEVAWEVENGTYAVSANADGYLSAEDSVDIDGGNASLTLTLEEERDGSGTDDSSDDGSTVTFVVEDGNGEPLDNATVALERESPSLQGNERKTVDRNGEVDFEREDDEYTFTVIVDGTESDERTVDVDGDTRRRVTATTDR